MNWLMHYLDDYLTLGASGSTECAQNLAIMIECCDFGSPIETRKSRGSDNLSGVFGNHSGYCQDGNEILRGACKRIGNLIGAVAKSKEV